ncbi:MAG: hypothetical protein CMH57_12745 [Myxococcales bacterium]|nr:hypothetical protein [Myxococcales bacterium]
MSVTFAKYAVSMSRTGGKFWEVEVEGAEMRVRYGKIGQERAWSSKSYPTPEKAEAEAQKKWRGKLQKGYTEAPRPSAVSDAPIREALTEIPLGGVLYFRALERFPGGNADMFTIKVLLQSIPGEAPKMTAAVHWNWDGSCHAYDAFPLTLDLSTTLPAFLTAAEAMLAADHRDVSVSIEDTRTDREEYDTEWSSIELTLHRLPDGATDLSSLEGSSPFLRVLQKAISFKAQAVSPPDEVTQAFIDGALRLAGLTRVEARSEGADLFAEPFRSAKGREDGGGHTVKLYI